MMTMRIDKDSVVNISWLRRAIFRAELVYKQCTQTPEHIRAHMEANTRPYVFLSDCPDNADHHMETLKGLLKLREWYQEAPQKVSLAAAEWPWTHEVIYKVRLEETIRELIRLGRINRNYGALKYE